MNEFMFACIICVIIVGPCEWSSLLWQSSTFYKKGLSYMIALLLQCSTLLFLDPWRDLSLGGCSPIAKQDR